MRVQPGLVHVALVRTITSHVLEHDAEAAMMNHGLSLTAVQPRHTTTCKHAGAGFKHDT